MRYCKSCRAYILSFDHHCPAFGNCIVQNSFRAFYEARLESSIGLDLISGGLLFTILQMLWQGIFFLWRLDCICFNIKTKEWVNWKNYPEFQLVIDSEEGRSSSNPRFTNPYNKGITGNFKWFLSQGGPITWLL